jgi:hypothetical protein
VHDSRTRARMTPGWGFLTASNREIMPDVEILLDGVLNNFVQSIH